MLRAERGGLQIGFRENESGGGGGLQMPKRPRFKLGRTFVTAAAVEAVDPEDVRAALKRHETGDWGDLDDEDKQTNERALREGDRLFSVYHDRKGTKFYIITEWNRKATTIMLPEDY